MILLVPERRRGDEALTDIPIEIYYAILEEVIPNYAFASSFDKRTLGSLSLVCRFFRQECQFRQFEILTFPLMKTWFVEKSHPRSQWMSALQRGDSRAKQLAKHVLTCSLSLPNNPRRQGLAYSIKLSMRSVRKPEGYLSALSTFTHLQYLTLFSYPISMTLLQAIATLPELSSLCWFGCPRVIGKPTRLELSGRGICMFDFIQCSADASALALFLSPILQLLDIQGLQRLATDVPSLLAAVFEAETETEIELEELEVQCRDPGAIAAAERNLHRWPQLAALSMHYSCPLFAPAIVPNLTSLSCLVDTAAAFLASNRPISKLTILESGGIELEDHIPNLIRAITPSRPVQLTHLSIPLDAFMCFPPAWTLSVRELTVVIPERGFERPAADIGEPMVSRRFHSLFSISLSSDACNRGACDSSHLVYCARPSHSCFRRKCRDPIQPWIPNSILCRRGGSCTQRSQMCSRSCAKCTSEVSLHGGRSRKIWTGGRASPIKSSSGCG